MRTQEAAARGVRAVYQELSLVPGMSIAENMFLGAWPHRGFVLDHREMERRTGAAMQALGLRLDPRREVSTFSTAERQMVEIARAVMGEPQLVILDEPTSSLHAAEVEQVFKAVRALAARRVAVIYVSHRMPEIREIAEAATIVRDGRIIETLPVKSARTADIVRMMLGKEERDVERIVSTARPEVLLSVRRPGGAAQACRCELRCPRRRGARHRRRPRFGPYRALARRRRSRRASLWDGYYSGALT